MSRGGCSHSSAELRVLDLILEGGMVIDGTRASRFQADVGIVGDRIEAIGNLREATARQRINVEGRVVAPGFIDVHNHSDGWLSKIPNFQSKTLQGFTTELLMVDGISYAPVNAQTWREWFYYLRSLDGLKLDDYAGWESIAEYLAHIEGRTAQNVAAHIPYSNVRTLACGFGRAPVDDFQRRLIDAELHKGMQEGAIGLSTGIDYVGHCFATTDELVDACRIVAGYGGVYVTHVRYKRGLFPALNEAVEIAKRSGIKLHISHLKAWSGVAGVDQVLEWIEKTRREVDLSFDVYPYQPGSTMLNYLLPYEVWEDGPMAATARMRDPAVRARFAQGLKAYPLDLDHLRIAWVASKENSVHQGKRLSDYVREMGQPAEEALYNLLLEERLAVLLVFDEGDDVLVRRFLQHDLYMMGTDGIWHADGIVHPRQYGSAGRLIGPCVRDLKLFPLEDAVHKLSARAAERFGLAGRGTLTKGNFADVVVFDPATVTDRATYENPHQPVTGIDTVLVNGKAVVERGAAVLEFEGSAPGRALRFQMFR
jgi:N-acyl-D-amino-acid deacylase